MARLAAHPGRSAPLLLGAALAAQAAHAKAPDPGEIRTTGPDPIASANAAEARAIGRNLLRQNKPVEALQAYRQALAQDPDSVESLNGMAVSFDRLGRYDEARLHYEMALGIDPTSPMLLNNYGLSLAMQGDLVTAQRFLRLAAASGDADVQAASLAILAKVERRLAASGSRPQPAARLADTQPAGPSIVRTSGHEQRLVVGDSPVASVVHVATRAPAPEEAAVLAAVAPAAAAGPWQGFATDHPDAPAAAGRAEAVADVAVPADMQVARLLAEARARAEANPHKGRADQWGRPLEPAANPDNQDWYRYQVLVMAPAPAAPGRRAGQRTAIDIALVGSGLAPPRRSHAHRNFDLPADAVATSARRFDAPFDSDDARLNGFAALVLGADAAPSVAEQVARLEALIARVAEAA